MVVDDVNVRARGLKYALVIIVWCFLWEVFCYESSTCLELFKVFLGAYLVIHETNTLWFGDFWPGIGDPQKTQKVFCGSVVGYYFCALSGTMFGLIVVITASLGM